MRGPSRRARADETDPRRGDCGRFFKSGGGAEGPGTPGEDGGGDGADGRLNGVPGRLPEATGGYEGRCPSLEGQEQ